MNSWKMHSERRSVADRWGLFVVTTLVAMLVAMLFVSVTRAQDRPDIPALDLPACPGLAGIDANGAAVTFPRETADCMLARVRLVRQLVPYVVLLEQRIERDDRRLELRDEEIQLAERQSDVATSNLDTAITRANDADDRLNAWYRHPVFLMGMGALVVVALEIVAIVIFKEVSP